MYINNNKIDLEYIQSLIQEEKIISAIKYVRNTANIGLKDSKDVVDKLIENKNFYNDEKIFINEREKIINRLKKNQKRKGSHFIKRSNKRNAVLFLILLIIILWWFFLK